LPKQLLLLLLLLRKLPHPWLRLLLLHPLLLPHQPRLKSR
jgi:hypothetical protein